MSELKTATDLIRIKQQKKEMSQNDIDLLVKGLSDQSIADYQVAAWLMATYLNGLSQNEIIWLTQALRNSFQHSGIRSLEFT